MLSVRSGIFHLPGADYTPQIISKTTAASVAEPPLFWAAPAPDVRGPGADTKIFNLGSEKCNY